MPPLTETVVLQPLIAVGEDAETGGKPRRPQRRSYARIQDAIEVPKLIETQINSFDWFKRAACASCSTKSPRSTDFTGKNMALSLSGLQVRDAALRRVRVPRARPDLFRAAQGQGAPA